MDLYHRLVLQLSDYLSYHRSRLRAALRRQAERLRSSASSPRASKPCGDLKVTKARSRSSPRWSRRGRSFCCHLCKLVLDRASPWACLWSLPQRHTRGLQRPWRPADHPGDRPPYLL